MAKEPSPASRVDRLKQLRAFCHSARLGSITRAAEYIFSSQPAVSLQVRALEDELGVTLFKRKGPRISLTPTGRRLYEATLPVVVGLDRMPDTFAERHRGEISDPLVIAAGRSTAAYALPKYLKRFRERYPDIQVRVRLGTGRERIDWLRAYEVDIAFIAVGASPPDLSFHFAFPSRHYLITSEDHPLAGRQSVELAEAVEYPVIAPPVGTYVRYAADMAVRQHRMAFKVVAEVHGWNVIKRFVEAGVGVSVVPDICLDDRARVWRFPFDRYFMDRRYGILTRREGVRVPSLAAERFIQLIDPSIWPLTR